MSQKIFEYSVGDEKFYADPMEIDRKMFRALGGDVNGVIDKTQATDDDGRPKKDFSPEVQYQAMTQLLEAIRFSFDLAAFDKKTGKGVTSSQALDVWNAYSDFMDEKKSPASS